MRRLRGSYREPETSVVVTGGGMKNVLSSAILRGLDLDLEGVDKVIGVSSGVVALAKEALGENRKEVWTEELCSRPAVRYEPWKHRLDLEALMEIIDAMIDFKALGETGVDVSVNAVKRSPRGTMMAFDWPVKEKDGSMLVRAGMTFPGLCEKSIGNSSFGYDGALEGELPLGLLETLDRSPGDKMLLIHHSPLVSLEDRQKGWFDRVKAWYLQRAVSGRSYHLGKYYEQAAARDMRAFSYVEKLVEEGRLMLVAPDETVPGLWEMCQKPKVLDEGWEMGLGLGKGKRSEVRAFMA